MPKELLERRFKNKKIEVDEKVMAKLVKKLGFKETSDFYSQIADGKLDANDVIEKYIELRDHENQQANNQPVRSAEEFEYENPDDGVGRMNDDVLVIDQSLKGIDYTLARCCHPSTAIRCSGSSRLTAASRSTEWIVPMPPNCASDSATES